MKKAFICTALILLFLISTAFGEERVDYKAEIGQTIPADIIYDESPDYRLNKYVCYSIGYVVRNNEAIIIRIRMPANYSDGITRIDLPETLGGYPVTGIGQAFMNSIPALGTLGLPSTMRDIDGYDFYGTVYDPTFEVSPDNPYLTVMNDALVRKEDMCLLVLTPDKNGKIKKQKITYKVPDGIRSIGDYAFAHNIRIREIILPDSIVHIGNKAFYQSYSLQKIRLPEHLESAGTELFADTILEDLVLPEAMAENIHQLSLPSTLKSITLPDNVTELGDYNPFWYCKSLTKILVSKDHPALVSVKGVLYSKDQTRLVCCPPGIKGKLKVPDGVTEIGNNAFEGCDKLTEVVLPNSLIRIGPSAFSECKSLKKMVIPEGTVRLENHVFNECENLSEISLPESLRFIGAQPFQFTSLKELTIPEGVEELEGAVFAFLPEDFTATVTKESPADYFCREYSLRYDPVNIRYAGTD